MITPLTAAVDGTQAAHYSNITLRDFHILTPGQFIIRGPDADHAVGVSLDNVVMDGAKPDTVPAKFAKITIVGRGAYGVVPGGEGVTIDQSESKAGTLYDCTDKFTEFPVDSSAPVSVAAVAPTTKTIYIAADGSAQFYSLEAALHRVPPTGAVIQLAPGIYRERAYISQNHVTLRSLNTDPTKTVLVYDTGAGNGRIEHSPLPGGGATLTVMGDDFLAENITIQNDYKRTHHQPEPTSAAEALYTESDRSVFRNVHILGVQDTLFIASKSSDRWCKDCKTARMYFSHALVAGGVDFIYGDAKAVFDDCEIHSVGRGYLTAQSKHYPAQDSGFVFNHCKLTAEPGVQGVYLGRPWQSHATVVYLNTEMGAHIIPVGWSEWHDLHRLDTAFFAEYNSTGPGADAKDRTPKSHQLTAAEAARFEPKRFLAGSDGWDPTKVK
jgi:pectin methylesterase-like acyl-CoA thioesterase